MAKFNAKQVARELKKGKTVSGQLPEEIAAELSQKDLEKMLKKGQIPSMRKKDVDKIYKKRGPSVYAEGTLTTRRGGGIAGTLAELTGKGYKKPGGGRSSWW